MSANVYVVTNNDSGMIRLARELARSGWRAIKVRSLNELCGQIKAEGSAQAVVARSVDLRASALFERAEDLKANIVAIGALNGTPRPANCRVVVDEAALGAIVAAIAKPAQTPQK